MSARWTIRLGAMIFAIGLIGSNAFAAKEGDGSRALERVGSCAGTCQHAIVDTLDDPYPAYQPLEVCDDVCIFY